MRDVELAGKDRLTFGWVICMQKDREVYGFVGENMVLFEDVTKAVVYETKSGALQDIPKSMGNSLILLAEANGTSILDELAEVPIKDIMGLFQIKELRVVI